MGKNERLKSRKLIDRLFAEGQVITAHPFRLLFRKESAKNEKPILQTGFAVSSRNFSKATDRNRIKRLMREAYRLNKPDLLVEPGKQPANLEIFLIYIGKELPEWNIVKEKMDRLIVKLISKANEPSSQNS